MNTLTRTESGRLVLTAPCDGCVWFLPPPQFAGELEVFARGDVIAVVGRRTVEAPTNGFVVTYLADEGTTVHADAPLVTFREA
jgi:hypothetical protein